VALSKTPDIESDNVGDTQNIELLRHTFSGITGSFIPDTKAN